MSLLKRIGSVLLSMGPILSPERLYIMRLKALTMPGHVIAFSAVENHAAASAMTRDFTMPGQVMAVPTTGLYSVTNVDGAARFDNPAYTDETAAATNDTTNDMTLSGGGATVATGDGYVFGYSAEYDGIYLRVGTAGVGTYTVTWKYWNGTAWANLTLKYDENPSFKTARSGYITWTGKPADWAKSTIVTLNLYWVFASITMGTMTTKPKGTRSWVIVY